MVLPDQFQTVTRRALGDDSWLEGNLEMLAATRDLLNGTTVRCPVYTPLNDSLPMPVFLLLEQPAYNSGGTYLPVQGRLITVERRLWKILVKLNHWTSLQKHRYEIWTTYKHIFKEEWHAWWSEELWTDLTRWSFRGVVGSANVHYLFCGGNLGWGFYPDNYPDCEAAGEGIGGGA